MQKNSNLNNKILEFKNVSKKYADHMQVDDMSFSIFKDEFICLVGPSGCGKSTVLKMIVGIEKKSLGEVICDARVSMVFQNGALLPWLDVYENIAIALRAINTPDDQIDREVRKYVEMMKLEKHIHSLPNTLSGGQKQRVGIARALAVRPELLLLDEPFSALDEKTSAELHFDLHKIYKEMGITVLMITHQIEEAVTLADRVLVMTSGKILKEVQASIDHPRREHELEFMRTVNEIRAILFRA